LLISLIIIISKLIFKKRLNNIGLILAENTAKYSSYIHFSMNCIKDIKLFQSESQFEKKFNNFFKKYSRASALNQFLNSLSRFLIEIYLTLIIAAFFIYIHFFDLNVENFLPILTLFAVATLRLLPSGSKIISNNNTISFLNPMVKDVLRLIDNSNLEEIKKGKLIGTNNNNLKEMDNVSNKLLQLKKISFQFISKDSSVETKIKNVNFDIKKNSFFGIIGKSGSGKSTLLNIICGLIDPISGKILYNDQNISQFKEKWLTKIGYVSQEVKLFDETILENIRFGKPDASDAEIRKAAKMAYVDEFSNELKDGLNTVVGPRGSTLSGGQRQRISIARAFLRNSPLLLLDEPTSALDSQSEKLIQKSLSNLSKQSTTITIAHRLSTIVDSNKVLVLDNGKIVEQGKHDSLLQTSELYYKLFKSQVEKKNDE